MGAAKLTHYCECRQWHFKLNIPGFRDCVVAPEHRVVIPNGCEGSRFLPAVEMTQRSTEMFLVLRHSLLEPRDSESMRIEVDFLPAPSFPDSVFAGIYLCLIHSPRTNLDARVRGHDNFRFA